MKVCIISANGLSGSFKKLSKGDWLIEYTDELRARVVPIAGNIPYMESTVIINNLETFNNWRASAPMNIDLVHKAEPAFSSIFYAAFKFSPTCNDTPSLLP